MNYGLTEEQSLLEDSLEAVLADQFAFARFRAAIAGERLDVPELWTSLCHLGLMQLSFAESRGGLGGGALDLAVVAGKLDGHLVLEPWLPTVLCGRALECAHGQPLADRWLRAFVDGTARGAFAPGGTAAGWATELVAEATDGGGMRLAGRKSVVLGGHACDLLAAMARLGERRVCVVFEPERLGAQIRRYRLQDGRGCADFVFDPVSLQEGDYALIAQEKQVEAIEELARLLACAGTVGMMKQLLAQTLEYAQTRRQFGRPIMGFQAVAHKIADMKIKTVQAISASRVITAHYDERKQAHPAGGVLQDLVATLGREVAETAVQVHGAIAMTDEIAIGYYLKRIVCHGLMFPPALHGLSGRVP